MLVLLGAFGQRVTEALARRLEAIELTGNAAVLVVSALALRGPLRPSELQQVARLTSGGMTKQLDRLEALGLVQRSYGEVSGDRRASVVTLTPKGRDAAARMAEAMLDEVDGIRDLIVELSGILDEDATMTSRTPGGPQDRSAH